MDATGVSTARAQIERHLAKPTPDHLWVVGRRAERNALLEGVARAHAQGARRHVTSAYVDLAGSTGPATRAIAQGGLDALGAAAPERREADLEDLALALEPTEAAAKRLLLVIDGVGDTSPAQASAWTRLRAFAERAPVTVVAGGAATLRAMLGAPAPGAWTAWGLYHDTPIRLAPAPSR